MLPQEKIPILYEFFEVNNDFILVSLEVKHFISDERNFCKQTSKGANSDLRIQQQMSLKDIFRVDLSDWPRNYPKI
jgi:hypothetical protein